MCFSVNVSVARLLVVAQFESGQLKVVGSPSLAMITVCSVLSFDRPVFERQCFPHLLQMYDVEVASAASVRLLSCAFERKPVGWKEIWASYRGWLDTT